MRFVVRRREEDLLERPRRPFATLNRELKNEPEAKREDLAMLICECNAMHRRDVMCGGGAAMFSAIVATLMASSKPVKAEAISGSVPELDSVAVRVVVDSYQFAVAPSGKLADVDIQHFGWGVSAAKRPRKPLISEFG